MNMIRNKIILMFAIIFGTVLKSFLLEFYCLEKLQVLFNEEKKNFCRFKNSFSRQF